jgi:hypothetical protein
MKQIGSNAVVSEISLISVKAELSQSIWFNRPRLIAERN